MSTTVDERVVSMQFDNKHFESNVKTSMSTIDKLKQSLKFDKSTKGFDDIEKSAKNVNMAPLSSAVDSVKLKFSAMQVMAVTALTNITNAAYNAGVNIVKSLTIDPVKTGFQEYETQIKSVQTILANTSSKGSSLQDVNAALAELNTYADMTIYNFTEMTRNIGTFTAAGVDLDKSVAAIKGISNLAAVSGSTSEQASNAMYQLSQALASGTVKLMDWNSVVNAGMGGEVFQNSLKETASVHGINVDKMIKKEGSFRDTLSEGWLSSEILLETLSKFTGDLSKEQLESMGYTEDQIDEIIKLGQTANEAATKVKTFTQLLDTLKEAAQSGWTRTWEILIGDFEEAKEVWTSVSDTIGGMLGDSAQKRNDYLSSIFSSGWKQLLNQGITDENKYIKAIQEVSEEQGVSIEDMIENMQELAKANGETLSSSDAFHKILADGTISADTLTAGIGRLITDINDLSDEEKIAQGYTEDTISGLEDLKAKFESGELSMDEFYNKMTRLSGRELAIQAIANAFNALRKILGSVSTAFNSVFKAISSETIYKTLTSFSNWTKTLIISDETANKLTRTFKGLFAIIKIIGSTVAAPFKIAFQALSGILKAFDLDILDVTARIGDQIVILQEWFDRTKPIEKFFEKIGNVIKKAVNSLKEWGVGLKETDNIPKYLIQGIGNGISKGLSTLVKAGKNIGTKLLEAIKDVLGIHSPSTEGVSIGEYLIQGIANGIVKSLHFITSAIKTFWSWLKGLFSEKESEDAADEATKTTTTFFDKIKNIFKSIKISDLIPAALAGGLLVVGFKLVRSVNVIADAIGGFTNILDQTGRLIAGVKRLTNAGVFFIVAESIFTISKAIALMAVSILALSYLPYGKLWATIGAITAMIALMVGSVILLNKLGSTKIDIAASAATIISFGAAMALMAIAIKTIATIPKKDIPKAIGVLAAMTGMMAVIVLASRNFGKFDSTLNKGKWWEGSKNGTTTAKGISGSNNIGGTLMGMAFALVLMATAVKIIASIDTSSLNRAKKVIYGMLWFMTAIAIISRFGKAGLVSIGGTFAGLGIALLAIAIPIKILGSMSKSDLAQGMGAITALISVIGLFAVITKDMTIMSKYRSSSGKMAGTFIALGVSLLAISFAIKILGSMSKNDLLKGVGAISALILVIGLLGVFLKTTEKTSAKGAKSAQTIVKMGGTFLAIGAAMLSIAIAMKIISSMSWSEISKAGLVVGGIIALLGIIMAVVEKIDVAGGKAKKAKGSATQLGLTFLAIGAALLLISAAVWILGKMDTDVLLKGGAAIVVFLGMFIGLAAVTKNAKDITKTLIIMAVAIGVIAVSLTVLSYMDAKGVLVGAGAIVGVMAALTLAVKFAKNGSKHIGTLIVMTTAIGVIAASLAILAQQSWQSLLAAVGALVLVLAAFVGALYILNTIKTISPMAMVGAVLMLVIMGVLGAILYFLSKNDPLSVLGAAAGLSILILSLSGATVLLAMIGSTGPSAIIGVGILAGVILALGALFVAIGALNEYVPGIKKFIDEAGPLLASIGKVIGGFIGGIVKGFAEEVLSLLPVIADNLSSFMEKIQGFIDGAKSIDQDVLAGIGILVSSMLLLTGASFISGITGFFKDIGSLFTKKDSLTRTLEKFAGAIVSFSNKLTEGKINLDTINTAVKAMEAISNFQSINLDNLDNVIDHMDKLKSLFETLSSIKYDSLSGLTNALVTIEKFADIDSGSLSNATTQVSDLVDLASGTSGMDFSGMDTFSESLKSVAGGAVDAFVKEFTDSVATITSSITSMLDTVESNVSNIAHDDFHSVGKSIASGVSGGITANTYSVVARAKAMANASLRAAKEALNSNSPAEEFVDLGETIPEGLSVGIEKLGGNVEKSSEDMAKISVEGTSNAISKISDAIMSDIDAQPVIRPVLDLSDIASKSMQIAQMLTFGSSIGIMSNVGAIKTGMENLQNGSTTDDVLSAIMTLGDKLGGIKGDTYTINGVTYDDGSNVSSAVSALFRAAKIERRV